MAIPLLKTKLYIPPIRPDLVSRVCLIERIDAGIHAGHKMTLVSAPAGFGKTTLLSEWIAGCQQNRLIAWVSLDRGDNDPARFWAYFVAALQTVEPGIGAGMSETMQTAQPLSAEALLTVLINDIAAVPDRLVLVLDDYHLVTARPIHDGLAFLLDHLLPNLHLVIATRADPPLPIARLRGQGQLTELRQSDLRFTLDEAGAFLNMRVDQALSSDDIAALESRTEGWPAGLQMAALALQTLVLQILPSRQGMYTAPSPTQNVQDFVATFSGDHEYIADYLTNQVLDRQPEHVRTFLLQTSILDRFTGSLCDAVRFGIGEPPGRSRETTVSEPESSPRILERLKDANLFIVPLDNERRWYRYHHLFADLLRRRLHRSQPEMVPDLHRRASIWYEQNEDPEAAIEHALHAKDDERAADLIAEQAEATLMRSEMRTLLRWVDKLPPDSVRARPSLCLYHAWALLFSGHPFDAVESRLEQAMRSQATDDASALVSGEAAVIQAFVAILQGQFSTAAERMHQATTQLPKTRVFLRSFASLGLGLLHLARGQALDAAQTFNRLVETSRASGNIVSAVAALCYLAELRVAQGRLGDAKTIYQQMLRLAIDQQGHLLPIAGLALIGLADLALEWNDLDAATRHLKEGIALISRRAETAALEGYILLARVKQAQGDMEAAHRFIQRVLQITTQSDVVKLDKIRAAAQQARLWLIEGNMPATLRWAQERGLCTETVLDDLQITEPIDIFRHYHRRLFEYVVFARVLIAQQQAGIALALLERLLVIMEQFGLGGRVIELQILKALAFQVRGDMDQAMQALECALTLAEPEGYIRIFVNEGKSMTPLLRRVAAPGTTHYAAKLLKALEAEEKGEHKGEEASTFRLIEPLTEREIEVLRLLITDLASGEIGLELGISVNTVRFHIKNIYGKLGVRRRASAVHRAKELGLI